MWYSAHAFTSLSSYIMQKEPMPAAEAENEGNTYELAFHVLPTVAEGEVASVVDTIKSHITNAGGTVTEEEAPARFELAYEIVKHLEGRNRKFASAYFGWIRFTAAASAVEEITDEVEAMKEILRSLNIKLNKTEAANPFMFHEALESKQVENIEVEPEQETEKEEDDSDESEESDSSEDDTETESEETVDGEEGK